MRVSGDQLIRGVINYADNEVINNLPVSGKWVMGTGIGIATAKAQSIVAALQQHPVARAMGIVDDDGMIDLDLVAKCMKDSASRYGKMTLQVPLVGRLTFSDQDIDALRGYIERG